MNKFEIKEILDQGKEKKDEILEGYEKVISELVSAGKWKEASSILKRYENYIGHAELFLKKDFSLENTAGYALEMAGDLREAANFYNMYLPNLPEGEMKERIKERIKIIQE